MAVGTKTRNISYRQSRQLDCQGLCLSNDTGRLLKSASGAAGRGRVDRSVQAGERCNLDILADFRPALEAMADRTYRYSTAMRAAYAASVNEATTLQQFVSRMEQFNNQANRIISGMFGPAVARRAISQ